MVNIMSDLPPEAVMWADFLILVCVACSCSFLLLCMPLALLRRHLPSMQVVRPWTIVLSCTGAIMHIVGEYVSNAHLNEYTWYEAVRNAHCPLWDFWVKYMGFDLWFMGTAGRMISWYFVLQYEVLPASQELTDASSYRCKYGPSRSSVATLISVSFLGAPLFVLCTVVELMRGTVFDSELQWCITQLPYAVALVSCLAFCVAALLIILRVLRRYRRQSLVSYGQTRDSTVIGIGFLLALVLCNRLGVSVWWWGRALTTGLVIALYMSSTGRVMWKTLRNVARYGLLRDAPNAQELMMSELQEIANPDTSNARHLDELMSFDEMHRKLCAYVREQPGLRCPPDFSDRKSADELNMVYAASFGIHTDMPVHIMRRDGPIYAIDDEEESEPDADDESLRNSLARSGAQSDFKSVQLNGPRVHVIRTGRLMDLYDVLLNYRRARSNPQLRETQNFTLRAMLMVHFRVRYPRMDPHETYRDVRGVATEPLFAQFFAENYVRCVEAAQLDQPLIDNEVRAEHTLPLTDACIYRMYSIAAQYKDEDATADLMRMIHFLMQYKWLPAFVSAQEHSVRYAELKRERAARLSQAADIGAPAPVFDVVHV